MRYLKTMNLRWATPHARTLALALLLVVGPACGGGSPSNQGSNVLGKAFQSKAVAVCQAALAQKKAQGPFPYPDFNPTKPDLSQLASIGRFEAQTVTIYQKWLHEMVALGQPPTGQAAWANLMSALRGHVRIITEQQAAAQRADGQTFTKDYYEGNTVQGQMQRAGDAAGVPICASAAAA